METRIDILNELKELSPYLLAGMEKVNVFTVPEGYFDGFAETITLTVSGIEAGKLPAVNEATYQIPEGYFDNLADNILNKIKQQHSQTADDELKSVSPLLSSISKRNVYTVPAGYFENLASLVAVSAENAEEELKVLSLMLYSIQNEATYTLPQGYFNNLANGILEKVKPQPAKVVVMRKRTVWIKYAMAAIFTGVIALGALKFAGGKDEIKMNESLAQTMKAADEINKNGTFDKEMDNLSDDAIANYLSQNGQDVDASLVASLVDEKELPEQEDYLLDDNTLDNFLNNITNTPDLNN